MVTRTLLAAQMVCARCGTAFEGRFCPNCGTPVAAPPQVEGTPPNVRCSRCGTLYSGRFCPTCGLPAWSAWIPPMPPRPSVGYGFLNVAWMFSLIAFLVVLAIATAGLFGVLVPISAGIQNIRQGGTADPGFDSAGAWVFSPWGGPAAGSVNATGGNSGGHGEISLPGPASSTDAIISGYWSQPFNATGAYPYIASVRLDYRVFRVSNILANVTLAVYVDSSSGTPRLGTDVWKVTLAQPTNWTRAQSVYAPTGEVIPAIDVSSAVARAGRYYLKIAAIAWNRAGGPGTDTILGVDNVGLRWATAAFVQVALYAPIPILLSYTQAPLAFYLWTASLVAATVACLAVLVLRDHPKLLETIRMRSDRMPVKLRSRSATVALMQTFLAGTPAPRVHEGPVPPRVLAIPGRGRDEPEDASLAPPSGVAIPHREFDPLRPRPRAGIRGLEGPPDDRRSPRDGVPVPPPRPPRRDHLPLRSRRVRRDGVPRGAQFAPRDRDGPGILLPHHPGRGVLRLLRPLHRAALPGRAPALPWGGVARTDAGGRPGRDPPGPVRMVRDPTRVHAPSGGSPAPAGPARVRPRHAAARLRDVPGGIPVPAVRLGRGGVRERPVPLPAVRVRRVITGAVP